MKPKQRVILYREGIRPAQGSKSLSKNHENAKYKGIDSECRRCKRKLRFPERNHLADPANKIPCIEPI